MLELDFVLNFRPNTTIDMFSDNDLVSEIAGDIRK
jgi:hypothetical protein